MMSVCVIKLRGYGKLDYTKHVNLIFHILLTLSHTRTSYIYIYNIYIIYIYDVRMCDKVKRIWKI